jgi:hypothetical protein
MYALARSWPRVDWCVLAGSDSRNHRWPNMPNAGNESAPERVAAHARPRIFRIFVWPRGLEFHSLWKPPIQVREAKLCLDESDISRDRVISKSPSPS